MLPRDVTLVDANVLLYAADRSARPHEEAEAWQDRALSPGIRCRCPSRA